MTVQHTRKRKMQMYKQRVRSRPLDWAPRTLGSGGQGPSTVAPKRESEQAVGFVALMTLGKGTREPVRGRPSSGLAPPTLGIVRFWARAFGGGALRVPLGSSVCRYHAPPSE
jgi:hypothetical protein